MDMRPTRISAEENLILNDIISRTRGQLHGRRRGRKLRAGQKTLLDTLLPILETSPAQIADIGPNALFTPPCKTLWLEIGFGGGEHLAYQAENNPDVGLIGCEVFEGGIVTLLARIQARELSNIRVVTDDARLVLDALPDACLSRAFILFPDPWPKARHHKRRFISAETMASFARVLDDGAELRMATDDVDYLRVMLAAGCAYTEFEWLARRPADWRERPTDWPQTRYEAKALDAGRKPAFLRLARRPRIVPSA